MSAHTFPPDATPAQLHTVAVWQQMGDRCIHCGMARWLLELRNVAVLCDDVAGARLPICGECLDSALGLREVSEAMERLARERGVSVVSS